MILYNLVIKYFLVVAVITASSYWRFAEAIRSSCVDHPKIDCKKFIRGGFCANDFLDQCCYSCAYKDQPIFNRDKDSGHAKECGKVDKTTPLIHDGDEADPTKHPWNAGIYLKRKNGDMQMICGGTLISSHAVLTAAHCAEFEGGAKKLKVVLGKKYLNYNDETDRENSQYIDVKKIHWHEFYQGKPLNYILDVAILELKVPAEIKSYIRPACVDFENEHKLTDDMKGTVVGWGLNDTRGQQTTKLQVASVPYVSYVNCINMLEIKNNIPKDKFCTAVEAGKTGVLQKGDSGAGLTFEFDGRFYVYGIVSSSITDSISTFTDVSKETHLEFIRKVLSKIGD